MVDSTQVSIYDEVDYPSLPYPASHPDRLALIARLFGMRPTPVDKCSVLELGCGAGGNLLPMAELLPGSEFVGIDVSSQQIDIGRQQQQRAGLSNVRLEAKNLQDLDSSFGRFDYIICHGVYSWTTDEARPKILAVCNENLVENGVAYVNYNTYPGWHVQGMVRDIVRFHALQFESVSQRVAQARAIIDFLRESFRNDNSSYGALLRGELEAARGYSDAFLFHAFLNVVNHPCYLHEFVSRAREAGLQYLGDADMTAMWTGSLPPQTRSTLQGIARDTVELEQHLDFLRNTTSRRSLLVHRDLTLDRRLEPDSLAGLHVAANLQQESPAGDARVTFRTADGKSVTTSDPQLIGACQRLQEAWPESRPFDELAGAVGQDVRTADAPDAPDGNRSSPSPPAPTTAGSGAPSNWRNDLLGCFAAGLVELRLTPHRCSGDLSGRLLASRVARDQAADGDLVVNARHQAIKLMPLDRRVLQQLDGTRDIEQLADEFERAVSEGEWQAGDGVPDPDEPRRELRSAVERLADQGFLLARSAGCSRIWVPFLAADGSFRTTGREFVRQILPVASVVRSSAGGDRTCARSGPASSPRPAASLALAYPCRRWFNSLLDKRAGTHRPILSLPLPSVVFPSRFPTDSRADSRQIPEQSPDQSRVIMQADELRALQAPLKKRYQDSPDAALVTLRSSGTLDPKTLACRVDTGRGEVNAGLHPAAGGDGSGACSGDMLLDSLVACAGVTLNAVATAMGISLRGGTIEATGEMDFRGTLGVDRQTPVGVTRVRLDFDLDTDADHEQLAKLIKLTERYCVIYQTLKHPPEIQAALVPK